MHLAQALVFSPEGNVNDCRLGFCFRLQVGLYLVALNLTLRQTIFPRLPQIVHSLDISLFADYYIQFNQKFRNVSIIRHFG